jgi:predicted metal-binding membrane protein
VGILNLRLAGKIAPQDGPAAATLALIAIAAWLCFIRMTVPSAMPGMAMPESSAANFAMWEIMAIAMMTPTLALPVLSEKRGALFTLVFASGYLCVWSVFALLAAIVQQKLDGSGRWLLFALLAAGGLYQWTRLKTANLDACRSRATALGESPAAIFGGGVRYGLYCLGCCWLLMALMIATGMGNLWIALGLTLAMLGERFLPQTRHAIGAVCMMLAAIAS